MTAVFACNAFTDYSLGQDARDYSFCSCTAGRFNLLDSYSLGNVNFSSFSGAMGSSGTPRTPNVYP